MDTLRLGERLDELILKYREIAFSSWERSCPSSEHHFNDYAPGDPNDSTWWQADTDVLEIVLDSDGQKWANVSIVLYPQGVHSLPPALSAGLAIYEDGRVEGIWASGEKFDHIQVRNDAI
nr:hypothetical protein [uncultured Undibacterium sp.]